MLKIELLRIAFQRIVFQRIVFKRSNSIFNLQFSIFNLQSFNLSTHFLSDSSQYGISMPYVSFIFVLSSTL